MFGFICFVEQENEVSKETGACMEIEIVSQINEGTDPAATSAGERNVYHGSKAKL